MAEPMLWQLANLFDEKVGEPGRALADAFHDRAVTKGREYLDQLGKGEIFLAPLSGLLGAAHFAQSMQANASLDLAGGIVDLLRIGKGVAKGTVWGYVEDGLRLFSVALPATRALSGPLLRRMVGAGGGPALNRVMVGMDLDPTRGICGWVASQRAMFLTGRFWVTMDDLMRAGGLSRLDELGGLAKATQIDMFGKLGIRARAVPLPPEGITVEAAEALVRALPPDTVAVLNYSADAVARGADAVAALRRAWVSSPAYVPHLATFEQKLASGAIVVENSTVTKPAVSHAVLVHRTRGGVTIFDRGSMRFDSVGAMGRHWVRSRVLDRAGTVQFRDVAGELPLKPIAVRLSAEAERVREIIVVPNAGLVPDSAAGAALAIQVAYVRHEGE